MAELTLKEKLAAIQTELKAPKNRHNSFGNYDYRNAEDIQEALKPLEKTYLVTTIISDSIEEVGGRIYVKATVRMMDCESDEFIEATAYAREAETKKGMDDAQVTGATSSYARKYALNGLLLIDDTKDVDSEEYQKTKQKAVEASATPKKVNPNPNVQKAIEAKPEPLTDHRIELRNFIKQHGLDAKQIAQICGLNKDSTDTEYEMALIYARSMVGGLTNG